MSKTVSIVILTYNGEKYIKETVDSCLNQTYENVETIVSDDCSTDFTVDLLKSYGENIKLIANKDNNGIVKSLNKVVLSLKSDYFIFLGHDDILPTDHVENMVSEFDDETVAVHCNSTVIDGEGNEIKVARNDDVQFRKTNDCLFELSLDNFISSCGMIHRVDVFKQLNGWSEAYRHYGEWFYYIRELKYGKIKYTTKSKALYRRHETNITNTFKKSDVLIEVNNYKNMCRDLAFSQEKRNLLERLRFHYHKKIQLKNWVLRVFSILSK